MPWLIRLLGSMFLYRLLQRRYQAARTGRPGRAAPKVSLPVRDMVDDLGIGTHLMVAVAAGLGALLLGAVAVTLLILGPHWLGGIVAVLALIAVAVAWWQAHRFSRMLQMRNWRHHKIVIANDDETSEAR